MTDNILIVDDSVVERKLIRWLLEANLQDIMVLERDSGLNVVDHLIQHDVSVCVLDIRMPGKDGYAVLTDIKNNQKTLDIPVIICTGVHDIEGIRRALTLGALDYFAKPLSEEDMKIALPLKVKNAIELRRRQREIDFLSYHDKLTGLYNRRFIEAEMGRLDTERQLPISIIVGDVNGLKLTNDVFGHARGDALLITLADILRACCRKEDLVARWGGDEFLLLLPATTTEQAHLICQRISAACRCSELPEQQGQLSIALGTATKTSREESLVAVIRLADEAMYKHKLLESRSYRNSLIQSLQQTLYEKSCETADHVTRMASMSTWVGKALKLGQTELDTLSLLAMLHDIGKVAVSNAILTKPGPLNEDEWAEIRRHPEIGYRIIQSMPELAPIADGVLCHHEHWNGQGYPQGLSGEAIPLVARVIAVIDAYDAMTHDRPYRVKMTAEEAMAELQCCAGKQFDPRIVQIFSEVMSRKKAIR